MQNTNRRHLKKIYCLEFIDTCKKLSQHLNALNLRFFVWFLFFPVENSLYRNPNKRSGLRNSPYSLHSWWSSVLGGSYCQAFWSEHGSAAFQGPWMNRSIIPVYSGMDCRSGSIPCHNLSPVTALSLLLLAGKKSLIFNSEKLLIKLVNVTF